MLNPLAHFMRVHLRDELDEKICWGYYVDVKTSWESMHTPRNARNGSIATKSGPKCVSLRRIFFPLKPRMDVSISVHLAMLFRLVGLRAGSGQPSRSSRAGVLKKYSDSSPDDFSTNY